VGVQSTLDLRQIGLSVVTGAVARFCVLGPLTLSRAGIDVPLPGGRQLTLLALLLQAGGVPLSRDRLIDELWGERPPQTAVAALHVHISKLRSLIGDLLVLSPAGYALRRDGFDLDSWRFDELVTEARAAFEGDQRRATALVREALELVRGEPLCAVSADGAIEHWRRSLEEKLLQARLLEIDLRLAGGAAGELIAELEELVSVNRFEERAWAQLIRALDRAGRPAEALDTYQRLRRLFAAELGLEPGETLTVLQQQILNRGAQPGLTAAAEQSVSSLPAPPTPIAGRDSELLALAGMLRDPQRRLISLVGPGGVGKTRLVLEAAIAAEPAFTGGAAFVRLERLTNAELVLGEIAAALSRRPRTEAVGVDGLGAYLRDQQLLLVLDNFEHLLEAAPRIAELLEEAPGVRVLVSTRTPLRIRGEEFFEVGPLALPVSNSEDEIFNSPAVQLFLERARAADPHAQLNAADGSDAQIAATVCSVVDGLPLALELAGARAGQMGLVAVASQLTRPLGLGANALRDLPDRQRTLTATIRWSYDQLSAETKSLLRAAGAFIGGFTASDLASVVEREEIDGQLAELLDSSLVRRSVEPGRFELLNLVRAFAAEELAQAGEAAGVLRSHWQHFAKLLAPGSERFDAGTAPAEIAGPLRADHANIRTALDRAIASGDHQHAAALALGMRPLWFMDMQRQELQETIDRLLSTFDLPARDELLLLRAASFVEGFREGVTLWTRRLVDRAAELGDPEAYGIGVNNLFSQAINRQDRDEIRRLRPLIAAELRPDASDRTLCSAHYSLALEAYLEGSFDAAWEHANSSFEYAIAVGQAFMLASAAATRLMAGSARDGEIDPQELHEVMTLLERVGVPPLAVFGLWLVACYAAGVGSDTARRWLAYAARISTTSVVDLWPEEMIRYEAAAVLGIEDPENLTREAPQIDHVAALAEASAWVAGRDPQERSARPHALRFAIGQDRGSTAESAFCG